MSSAIETTTVRFREKSGNQNRQVEIALDRMVMRSVGELACIGDADLGLRGELQIAARFDWRGVPRNRNTPNIEPGANALERKRRGRRHVAEGVLPSN